MLHAMAHPAVVQPQAAVKCARTRSTRLVVTAHSGSAGGNGVPPPQAAAGTERTSRRAALAAVVAGIAALKASPAAANEKAPRDGEVQHTDAEWRQLLPPNAYAVLRQARTEGRNSSPLVDEKRTGTFVCGGCGLPLFPSEAKYESGTGWPSFYQALPDSLAYEKDESIIFMPRVEVRCQRCLGHIGHVFSDGPEPTGLRFCMNGAAMRFEPATA